jgi:N-acetylglucosamine kinase-like BadF-type ATPase
VSSQERVILSIDAGGTKTLVAGMRLGDGTIATVRGDGSNYQGIGIARAKDIWRGLVDQVLAALGGGMDQVASAGLGIAGYDRPKDAEVIKAAFDDVLPGVPRELTNDAYLVLRAGTRDGVGVAVISGTGCNAMGTAADGKRFRIGGLGPDFGDLGSGTDIGTEALRRAFRSLDGRTGPTLLEKLIRQRFNLQRLDDLVDFFLADHAGSGHFHAGLLCPLVFEAAGLGDGQAVDVLEWGGRELANAARAVARRLFSRDVAFLLVMGGSVLQRGRTSHLRDALMADVRREFPRAAGVVLDVQPVAGGLLYALDLVAGQQGLDPEALRRKVKEKFVMPGPGGRP